jgi:hypothetical protein
MAVRVDCTNKSNRSWDGVIRLAAGRIVGARTMELESGQCSLTRVAGDAVEFRAAGALSSGRVTLDIEAPTNAAIVVQLGSYRLQTGVAELLDGSVTGQWRDGTVRLARDPNDVLRIQFDRPHLVYAPGEQAKFDLGLRLYSVDRRVIATRVRAGLRRSREIGCTFTEEGKLQVNTHSSTPSPFHLEVTLPAQEGAYDLVLRAEPAGLEPIERAIPFAVLHEKKPTEKPPADLVTTWLEEIDLSQGPAERPWYSRRALFDRTRGFGQLFWGGNREHGDATPAGVLGAYPLHVVHPDRPHLLTVTFRPDAQLTCALAIREQDVEGRWFQRPVTSAVEVRSNPFAAATAESHQVLFWPRTHSPTLHVQLDGAPTAGGVQSVRLHELPQGLPRVEAREPTGARRLVGLHVGGLAALESFGGSRTRANPNGPALTDWLTFVESTLHLAEYAQFAGYNSLMVTALGHGSALFPSDRVDANLALDSGTLFDGAADPARKDVVELLARICDRERLALVPALRFDLPLPALEKKLADGQDPRRAGILLVGRNGDLPRDTDDRGSADRTLYNPLNTAVQDELAHIVGAFAARYKDHPSFEAVALELAHNTCIWLPGLDWGYDDETVARFAKETTATLPATAADANRFAVWHQYLTGPAREQWTSWRARQLQALYTRLLAELQQAKPGLRLILAPQPLDSAWAPDLREGTHQGRSVEDCLRARGLDLRHWSGPGEIIVLRPLAATHRDAAALHLNTSRELDELLAKVPGRGSIAAAETREFTATEAADRAERTAAAGSAAVHFIAPLTATGRPAQRRFAHALAALDSHAHFEGGTLPMLGQEASLQEFARTCRALPETTSRSQETNSPVTVRTFGHTDHSLFCVTNSAAYPVETELTVQGATPKTLTNVVSGAVAGGKATDKGLALRLNLQPCQSVLLRTPRADAAVTACRVQLAGNVEHGLKSRFDRLEQANAVLGREATRTIDGLPKNGDFETSPGEQKRLPGWQIADGTTWALDAETVHGGRQAVRISCDGATGALASEPFTPAGRSAALKVWLRAQQPGTRVRLAFVATHDGAPFVRSSEVALGPAWQEYLFRVTDLPGHGQMSLSVRFELVASGTLWVDDARLVPLPVSTEERNAITKTIAAARKAWNDRRWGDFSRLAESYWAMYLVRSVEDSGERTDPMSKETAEQKVN